MKKVVFLVLMSLITIVSFGQFDIRASGGINVLSLTNEHSGATDLSTGSHSQEVHGRLGSDIGGSISFGNRLFIQPGVYWSSFNLNVVTENPSTLVKYENSPKINMIAIPLHVGIRFFDPAKQGLINVRLFVGFTGSHVLSVKDDGFTYSDASRKDQTVTHKKEDYKNMITSFDFGMGVDLGPTFIDAGYKIGISPLFNEPGNHTKASLFYINIGLKLSFFDGKSTSSSSSF